MKTKFLICVGQLILGLGCIVSAQSPSPTPSAEDAGWPRQIEKDGNILQYYQPQIDDWKDYKDLSARIAFALTPKDGKTVMGVASAHAGTIVDKEARTVYLRDIEYGGARFPSLQLPEIRKMQTLFKTLAPTGGEAISLDRLLADLEDKEKEVPAIAIKNDPPPIYYSATPTVLLMVEGDPVLSPVEKTGLQFVVNTNWDLFFEKSKKQYFLLVDNFWYTAADVKGPYAQTRTLPNDMTKIPAGQNFDDVKKMVPPPSTKGAAPTIIFSNVPAELILFEGTAIYTKIPGTQLLYVDNTENDIFLDNVGKDFYVLLSGRWFRSKNLGGPWEYASADLPTDFASIPEDSPKAHVLASVPGTVEAQDAVMLAQIPTSAIVNKAEAEAQAKVNYDGDPAFKPIEGTKMEYATNTQEKVIKVGDLYYLCFQAVWFMSTKPNGPWKTCDSVPEEIYTIPPSSEVYNVTYVTQTNATETTVQSNTTSGYFGMFVVGMAIGATIAYGTGYYYPPYMYMGPMYPYPIYRPYPMTYGCGAVYNPWTGGYAMGRSVYGPYGSAHSSAWYNPSTGRYGRSASVQGWYGGRTAAQSYNPYTGTYRQTQQGHNAYSQWGSSVATNGNQWAKTGHVTTARGTVAGIETSGGQKGVAARGANGSVVHTDNNTFAGHDGNIYKKNESGGWSQYNNGAWNNVDRNQNTGATQQRTYQGLDQSQNARQRGQMQQQQFGNFQRSGGGFGGGGRGGFHGRR